MKIKRNPNTKVTNFHETASHYQDMLSKVRDEIMGAITALVERLGGEIYLRYYHDEEPETIRYTYFMVNGNGYGVELFIDKVKMSETGEIELFLTDTEDTYEEEWDLSDLNVTDACYLLEELEEIAQWAQESHEDIVTEWEP